MSTENEPVVPSALDTASERELVAELSRRGNALLIVSYWPDNPDRSPIEVHYAPDPKTGLYLAVQAASIIMQSTDPNLPPPSIIGPGIG